MRRSIAAVWAKSYSYSEITILGSSGPSWTGGYEDSPMNWDGSSCPNWSIYSLYEFRSNLRFSSCLWWFKHISQESLNLEIAPESKVILNSIWVPFSVSIVPSRKLLVSIWFYWKLCLMTCLNLIPRHLNSCSFLFNMISLSVVTYTFPSPLITYWICFIFNSNWMKSRSSKNISFDEILI